MAPFRTQSKATEGVEHSKAPAQIDRIGKIIYLPSANECLVFLTRAPVLPCTLLRQTSPKTFRFINFCLAQGCLWSMCHLAGSSEEGSAMCDKWQPVGSKVLHRSLLGTFVGKLISQLEIDFCSYNWSSVSCCLRAQGWAGAKLERGHLQKGEISLLFPEMLRFLLRVRDKWWILMGGRLWDTNFTLKAKLYFFLFITAELWLSRAPTPPSHWTCALQRPKAALSPSMANETQREGNERNFSHLWSIKLI